MALNDEGWKVVTNLLKIIFAKLEKLWKSKWLNGCCSPISDTLNIKDTDFTEMISGR